MLADNPEMKPPSVIDSRTFGFIPMANVLGRVVYSGTSVSDHAPVTNSPLAQMMDGPILEQVCIWFGGQATGREGWTSNWGGRSSPVLSRTDGEVRGIPQRRSPALYACKSWSLEGWLFYHMAKWAKLNGAGAYRGREGP